MTNAVLNLNMQNKILSSVIEITQQRDVNSLEYSLIASLAELVPANELTLYKLLHKDQQGEIEKVVQLIISTTDAEQANYVWNREPSVVSLEPYLSQCIINNSPESREIERGIHQFAVPLSCGDHTVGIIDIRLTQTLSTSKELILALVTIYNNYLTILDESERDKLTGLFNRRTFDKKLSSLLQNQRKNVDGYSNSKIPTEQRHPAVDSFAWLVIMDIDHFKKVNDNYGHLYGDEVLLSLSQQMRQNFRQTDILFRFGGEEFVIIMEPIPYAMAQRKLERFRDVIANHSFPQIGKLTVSIGFAKITEFDFPPTILENADKALYYAKDHGRNCTFSYDTLVEQGKIKIPKTSGDVDLF